MTAPQVEVALAIGIIVIYLIDAVCWLRHDQAVIEVRSNRRWRVEFGMVGYQLAHRRMHVPRVLRPDVVTFPVDWSLIDEGKGAAASEPMDWHPGQVGQGASTGLGVVCAIALVQIVLIAPILLWIGWSQAFAFAIGCSYVTSFVAGAYLVVRAGAFGLRRRSALGLAVVALICLPCAPNLLRAAAGHGAKRRVTLPGFARTGVDGDEGEWAAFLERFVKVLELEVAYRDPQSPEGLRASRLLAEVSSTVVKQES